MKHNFEREQGNMRQEVDLELSKIRYQGGVGLEDGKPYRQNASINVVFDTNQLHLLHVPDSFLDEVLLRRPFSAVTSTRNAAGTTR